MSTQDKINEIKNVLKLSQKPEDLSQLDYDEWYDRWNHANEMLATKHREYLEFLVALVEKMEN